MYFSADPLLDLDLVVNVLLPEFVGHHMDDGVVAVDPHKLGPQASLEDVAQRFAPVGASRAMPALRGHATPRRAPSGVKRVTPNV